MVTRVQRFIATRLFIATVLLCGGVTYLRSDLGAVAITLSGGVASLVTMRPRQIFLKRAQDHCAGLNYREAIADLTEVIRLQPNWAEALRLRGQVYLYSDQLSKARQDFDRAIQLDPSQMDTYRDRVHLACQRQDWTAALTDLHRLIAHAPQLDDYRWRGLVHQHLNHPDQALADFNHVLNQKPCDATYWARSTLYASQGDLRQALADVSTSIDLHPQSPQLERRQHQRAIWARYLGETAMSMADWDALISLKGAASYFYCRAVTGYFADPSHPDAALADLNQAILHDPHLIAAFWVRGTLYFDLDMITAALDDYEQATRLSQVDDSLGSDPLNQDEYGLLARGVAQFHLGDPEGALADLSLAAQLGQVYQTPFFPGQIQAWIQRINPDYRGQIADPG